MADGLATYKKMRNKFQNVCFLSLENTWGFPKPYPHFPKRPVPEIEKLFFHDCWVFCGLISHGHSSTSQMSDAKRCVRSRGSWRLGTSKAKGTWEQQRGGSPAADCIVERSNAFILKSSICFLVSAELRNHTDFRGPSNENYKEDQWNTKNWLFYVPWLVVDTLWGSSKSKGRAVAGSKIRRIRAAFWLWCP